MFFVFGSLRSFVLSVSQVSFTFLDPSFLIVVLINTIVASGRLGCCCVVGCPNNSISPVNLIEDRTVEIDSDSDSEESVA